MVITIIGLGLIGGSLAMNIRKKEIVSKLIGVDTNENHATDALHLGLVDSVLVMETAVPQADLIIIAIPVDQTASILPKVLDRIKPDAVVMDVGSTKENICIVADEHPLRSRFVAAHTIAGTEDSGPRAVVPFLFDGKLTIICDGEKSDNDALETVERFFTAVGMRIVSMNSKDHDLHAAYVSHLSHISSFTLGLTVLDIEKDEDRIFDLADSGFESTVRLAKSSPDMWAPIFEQNSKHLTTALDAYINRLVLFKNLIEKNDRTKLRDLMYKANDIRRILKKNNKPALKSITVRW